MLERAIIAKTLVWSPCIMSDLQRNGSVLTNPAGLHGAACIGVRTCRSICAWSH